MMQTQTRQTRSILAVPGLTRSSRVALGAVALGASLLLSTASSAGASSLPASQTRALPYRTYHTAVRRAAPFASAARVWTPRTAGLSFARVRYLPAHAARQAQGSVVTLVTAWQRGLYRRSPTHPVANWAPQVQVRQLVRPAPVVYGDAVHDAIYQASQRWSVNYWYLVRLATCESTLNPGAYNPSGASGLFQFMPSTYYAYGSRIGEGRSLWNAYGSANVAAYMISIGQARQWTCASYI